LADFGEMRCKTGRVSSYGSAAASFTVLFVCTGNICRSPVAERLARTYADAVLGADAASMQLESAGTRAVVGSGVHPHSATVLTGLGGCSGGFVARQLTDAMVVDADLTLGLTRAHRREALKRSPRGLSRTFTLLEAADLASLIPRDAVLPGATFADRCRSLVRHMAAARAHRASDAHDDIPDPVGESLGFHEEVGDAIADGIGRIFGRFAELNGARHVLDRMPAAPPAYFLSGR
jgi:protein-tyrosine-phosphatase